MNLDTLLQLFGMLPPLAHKGMLMLLFSEKCRINSFGIFLMAIYPGAFVDIADGVHRLSPISQLRMYPYQRCIKYLLLTRYCGGSWHNAVLALACCILLVFMPSIQSSALNFRFPTPPIILFDCVSFCVSTVCI